jgi:hypothetical protein
MGWLFVEDARCDDLPAVRDGATDLKDKQRRRGLAVDHDPPHAGGSVLIRSAFAEAMTPARQFNERTSRDLPSG